LLCIGTSIAGFVMSQHSIWGGLAVFITTIAPPVRRNNWRLTIRAYTRRRISHDACPGQSDRAGVRSGSGAKSASKLPPHGRCD
jgi:hypothetical protein